MKVVTVVAATVVLVLASTASAASVPAGVGALEPTVLAMLAIGTAGLLIKKRRN